MTGTEQLLATVGRWFADVEVAGLILPDGWFGRPYDGAHRLTWSAARPHRLFLELDQQLVLILTDPLTASAADGRLTIAGSSHIAFDWQEYGNDTMHFDTYPSGDIQFVS